MIKIHSGNNIIEYKIGCDFMKNKPDDRSDNVERIQNNIDNTIKNINLANEVIAKSDCNEEIQNMKQRNERREVALEKMRSEIKDEAMNNSIQ